MKRDSFLLVYAFLSFSLLLNACGSKPAAIPPLSAALSELQGTVLAKQAGQSDFTRVPSGFVLEQNGQVQTGDDGRVRLDLSTGTIFRVAPSSLFTLVSNTPTDKGLASKLNLEKGKIWIILSGGSVDVETPSGVASVRGSYLMVEVIDNGAIKLTCLEGDCNLRNDSGDFPLITGQTAIVLNAQIPPFIQNMTDQEVQEWLDANPEAVIVVPSLTLPAPSVTTEPTFTSIPDTATSEPTSTTEPTATTAPTATFQSSYNPPPQKPPKPPPPTPTPDPNALVYLVSNIDINGGRFGVNVSPGGSVTVKFIYIIWNQADCPGCIDQLVVGLDDGGIKTGYGCGYDSSIDGIPGVYPGTGPSYSSSTPVTFSAPTAPGTYSVGIDITQQYGCDSFALAAYGGPNYKIIGSITVP